jgi:hypothetical protein
MDEGQHRGAGGRRRGVAAWVWAAPLALVVVAACVVGWYFLARGASDDDTSADDCLAGDLTLLVWADPVAQATAGDLVDSYNAGSPVVRDHCVRALLEVRPVQEAVDAYRSAQPDVAPVWFPVAAPDAAGLPGAPETVPVLPAEDGGRPLVVFGSSPSVDEDEARAAADFGRTVAPDGTPTVPVVGA